MKIDCLSDCFIGLPGKWKVLLNRFEVARFAVGNIPVKLVALEMGNIAKYEIVALYNVKNVPTTRHVCLSVIWDKVNFENRLPIRLLYRLPGKWKLLLNRFEVAQFAVGNIPVKLVVQ